MKDADALSRMDSSPTTEHCEQVCRTELVFDAEFQPELISLSEVKNVTEMCSLSKRLKKRIISGKWGGVSQVEEQEGQEQTTSISDSTATAQCASPNSEARPPTQETEERYNLRVRPVVNYKV